MVVVGALFARVDCDRSEWNVSACVRAKDGLPDSLRLSVHAFHFFGASHILYEYYNTTTPPPHV